MRTDYTLYTLAVAFFIITIASAVLLSGPNRLLWTIPFAILAGISVGVGLSRRPHAIQTPTVQPTIPQTVNKPQEATIPKPKTIVAETPSIVAETEIVPKESQEPIAIPPQPTITIPAPEVLSPIAPISNELTQVNGIGEKRAAQLNAIGIKTVMDLANASAQDIAEKLKVSPKISAKWITNAGKLYKKEN